MPCKLDLCACELGLPVFVLLMAFPNYCLVLDFFLVGDIYINYGTPPLEFGTSNDCLTEKAVLVLIQQRYKNGSPFCLWRVTLLTKWRLGLRKMNRRTLLPVHPRNLMCRVSRTLKIIHIRLPCRTEDRAYKWVMRNLGVIEVRLAQLLVNEFRAN